MTTNTYARLRHPTPAPLYANYPFYTTGGSDRRWVGRPETQEGMHWVGGLMYVLKNFLTAPNDQRQLIHVIFSFKKRLVAELIDSGVGLQQYASFSWDDLWTIAPWMEERVHKRIDGPGLGN